MFGVSRRRVRNIPRVVDQVVVKVVGVNSSKILDVETPRPKNEGTQTLEEKRFLEQEMT